MRSHVQRKECFRSMDKVSTQTKPREGGGEWQPWQASKLVSESGASPCSFVVAEFQRLVVDFDPCPRCFAAASGLEERKTTNNYERKEFDCELYFRKDEAPSSSSDCPK